MRLASPPMGIDVMLSEIEDYYWTMAARGRLLTLEEGRVGLCTFFLLPNERAEHRYYCRPTWSTPADDPQGTLAYIDKLTLRVPGTREIVRTIARALVDRYPQLTRAVWYRPSQDKDRRYTSYRRRVVA